MDGVDGEVREFIEWMCEKMVSRQVIISLEIFPPKKLSKEAGNMTTYALPGGLTIWHIVADVRSPLLVVVVHELLHMRFPNDKESAIEDWTTMVLEHMTVRDYVRVLQLLAKVCIEG